MRDVVDIAGCTVLCRRWSLVVSHLAIANASSLGGWNFGFALGGLVEHFREVLKFMTQMGVADLLLCFDCRLFHDAPCYVDDRVTHCQCFVAWRLRVFGFAAVDIELLWVRPVQPGRSGTLLMVD